MVRRKHLKALVVVLAVTTSVYLYTCIDFTSSRHAGQSPGRRLHIVRITNEDISKLGGDVELPNLAPSLLYPQASPSVAVIPPPSPLRAVPSQSSSDARREGDLLYDASDALPKPSPLSDVRKPSGELSQPEATRLPKPIDLVDRNPIEGGNPSEIESKNVEVSREDAQRDKSAYTKEKEVIELANLGPMSESKRKKLELYLSHLSSDQFKEVYRNIIGYENDYNRADIPFHQNALDATHFGPRASAPLHLMLPGKALGLTDGTRSQASRRCVNGCVGRKSPARILRGYSARVEIESLTLPPDWTFTPEIEERLQRRQEHVKQVCRKHDLDVPSANNSINAWEFFISDKFKLVWCSVFKAASSTWMYNFNVLAGYSENFLLKAKDTPISLARKKYPRPTAAELEQAMNQTEKPLSFLIARHPLHRLVSAYRDKLMSGQRFYSKLARKIVSTYPHLGRNNKDTKGAGPDANHKPGSPHSKMPLGRKMVVPTFPQFVQYLIDSHKRGEALDEHWTPINTFCTPCLFPFDVIAKLETIDEDSNYVIFKSGIEHYIKPKRINRNKNAPTDEVADSFLCQLSTEMMKSLIEIYKMDLELFEYSYDHYLKCTTDQVRLERVGKVR